jgi:transposase
MYDQENEPTNVVPTKIESSTTATRSGDTARALIRRAKQASRRRFPSEEKIRILLEGVRAEVSVAELCRREGIHPAMYCKWLKDFMEAGKKRLRGDTQREANREEVEQLRQDNQRLKQLVADLSLANMTLKKSQYEGCWHGSGTDE